MNYTKISQLFVLGLILFSCGCKSNNGKAPSTDLKNGNNLENQGAKLKSIKFDDYMISKDTLIILSDDDFLDYPFGCFKIQSKLIQRLNFLEHKQEIYKSTDEVVKLERFYSKNNFIKFYFVERFIDNKTRYEIVSAIISDDKIVFDNGVHVGMSINEFFSTLSSTIKVNISDINVVKLYWDVLGISHYYYFEESKLELISIKTDFLVNQE